MERWLIELSEAQLEQLPSEQLELGTLVSGASGRRYLVFRDGFVALKVASKLGAKRSPGRMMTAEACRTTPLAHLDDGTVLVAAGR